MVNELEFWLLICQTPTLYALAGRLADRLGGPERVWTAGKDDLMRAGCSAEQAERVEIERRKAALDPMLDRLDRLGVSAVCIEDVKYPESLRCLRHPPRLLFYRGSLDRLGAGIAVVGSRRATVYGKAMAETLSEDLGRAGLSIISGLARGIDTAAHQGALKGGGATVAVLGCGLDVYYPPENRGLCERIAAEGLVLSEYPPGALPMRGHFPARNRIIAGLSSAVVVVEAAEKSGALITVDHALALGKDVFAVPGNAKSSVSKGTHALLKQGAYLVDDSSDILSVLGIETVRGDQTAFDPDEERILAILGPDPMHADEIVRAHGDAAETSRLLTVLEIKGAVKKDYGGMYLRVK